ncbi:MAG: PduL/EutD family phosphate acyltransferase, partial [Oscillospiraceae bacterium]|nr:PduL/EutD family phosphate acyltransferase [Oscillospiraceae bacterium]
MTEQQIRTIVEQVLSALPAAAPCAEGCGSFPVEASARHVHLTAQAVETLFGPGAKLTRKRDLSQPGEFLSDQRLRIVTPKGEIAGVAVLGPERAAIQAELSATDCRALGLSAPVNLSGDLSGAADVYLVGPRGMLEAKACAIIARAHIHMTPPDAARFGVHDGQHVRVEIAGTIPSVASATTGTEANTAAFP